jgi:starch synthase
MITRLEYAKGIDILLKAVSYLDLNTFQLIILGSGKPYYQGMLSCISASYGDNIVVNFNYSSELAKKIYAAADIYLMPSLYEPCGLGQLYAMRYGAVPVVNPVGGLKDTVTDDPLHPEVSTGFYMENWSGEALCRAIKRAITEYHTPEWITYMRNGMNYDCSWAHSVSEYQKCYESLLTKK